MLFITRPISQKSNVKNFIEKFEKYGKQDTIQDTIQNNGSNESVNEIKVAPIKEKFEQGIRNNEKETNIMEQETSDIIEQEPNDIAKNINETEQEPNDIAQNINETERSENKSVQSEDDDFGNFSDASIDEDLNVNTSQFETPRLKNTNCDEQINSIIELMFNDTNNPEFTHEAEVLESQQSNHCDINSLLSPRSRIIYEQLVCLPIQEEPPLLWSNSYMRVLLYNILNIKDHDKIKHEELNTSPSKISTLETNTPINSTMFNQITELLNIKIQHHVPETEKFEEPVPKFNINEMKTELLQEIRNLSNNKELLELSSELIDIKLTHMELLKDKQTYEQVINNLVGHTQRLRRNEIAKYNKKHHRQLKRNSLWPI
ncbi:Uncharacterized protein AWRI3579_g2601 [Hanseniaspora osmophila]|uniref:Uncharacterized protein n=1 Tax=Hanseniaspora osmophila TaxID=56408 RepID=A0A1E5RAQ2_9ASCO|nr:Uncharacterized protein AWRI3579_g2601 [Hanseniaspora osmophila]